jgi:hypothetical protein
MNRGEPTTGSSSLSASEAGSGIQSLPCNANPAVPGTVDADLRASGRAEPLAARYLLGCIIGLDGMRRPFNIEQVINQG